MSHDGIIRIGINVDGKDVKDATADIRGLEKNSESAISKIKGFALTAGAFKLLSGAINLVKGSLDSAFNRIDTMEQFDRVMTTITGSADEAARALDTTNEAVLGTAYGLDTAAQAVQNFVTRGMEVESATDTIAAWGDAVAFYGDGSNAQLSSVADALSKMVTKGSVEMDQMNRLFDAGIPAVDIYADKVGMSTAEVQKQLSSGEISAEEFVNTMNEAFMEGTEGFASIEGAAKDAGATWGATFDNMRAAVARGTISIIASIDELLEDSGLPTMREMVSNFGRQFEEALNSAAESITTFGAPFLEVVNQIIEVFSGDANGLQETIETLIPRMVEWLQEELPLLLESGLEMVQNLALGISESSIGLKDSALELLGAFVDGIMESLPTIIETSSQVINTLLSSFLERYPDMLQAGADIILTIIEGVLENLPNIIDSGMTMIDSLVEGITMNLSVITDTVLEVITAFLDVIIENLPAIIDSGIELLLALVDGIIEVLPAIGESAIEIVDTLLQFITENLPEIIEKGKELLLKLVEGISDRLPEIATTAVEIMLSFVDTILENLPAIIGAGVEILLSLVEGILNSIFELDRAITESANIIIDGFNEISLIDIGKALIEGLWSGISSMGDWLWGKVTGFAGNVVGWFTEKFDIHSPSRVMAKIGQHVAEGLAVGMESKQDRLSKVTQEMAESVTEISKKVTASVNRQISEMEKEHTAEVKQLNQRHAEDVQSIKRKALEDERKLTKDEQIRIRRMNEDHNAKIVSMEEKLKFDRLNIRESMGLEMVKLGEKHVEQQIWIGNMSTREEAVYWWQMYKQFERGSAEYEQALANHQKVVASVRRDMESVHKDYANRIARIEQNLANETKRMNDDYARGSQSIKDTLAKDTLNIQNTLEKSSADVTKRLSDDIKRLNEEYANAHKSRVGELTSFTGLFERYQRKTAVPETALIRNLQSQVDALADYGDVMGDLENKIDNKALIEELHALGPDSLSELQAVNRMNDEQLTEFVKLYEQRFEMASERATKELEPLKKDTQKQIQELNRVANQELSQLKWIAQTQLQEVNRVAAQELEILKSNTQAQLKELNEVAQTELQTLETEWIQIVDKIILGTEKQFDSLQSIGADAIKGLEAGLMSQESSLYATATRIANNITKTIKSALKIKSPSQVMEKEIGRWIPEGIMKGIESQELKLRLSAIELVEGAFDVTGLQSTITAAWASGMPSLQPIANSGAYTSAISNNISQDYSKAFNPSIVNNFTKDISTPSEVARENKKQQQRLAMEWGY